MKLPPITLLTGALLLFTSAGAGAYPWSVCIAALGLSAGAVCCCRLPHRARLLDAALVAILLYLLLVMLPIPFAWTRIMGPERFEQNARVNETLHQAADTGLLRADPDRFYSMTRNRAGSMRLTILAAATVSAALLTATLPLGHRLFLLHTLFLIGAGIAGAGCVSLLRIPQGDALWWLWPIRHGLPGPVACFVNRNHFAGFAALLAPAALAVCFHDLTHRRYGRALLCLAALGVLSLGVAAAGSRGAMLAWAAGMLSLPLSFLMLRRYKALLALAAIAALAVALALPPTPVRAYAAATAWEPFKARLATLRRPEDILSLQNRIDAWRDGLRIVRTYPVFGAGPEAFRMVYPQHRTTSERAYLTHAENEYVQLAAEGGVAGIALGLLLVAGFTAAAWGSRAPPYVRAGAIGAACVAAVHAASDFALRVPLYTLTFAILLALLLPGPDAPRAAPPPASRARRLSPAALAALAMALLLAPFWRQMRIRDAHPYLSEARLPGLCQSLTWAPTSWFTWLQLGDACYVPASGPAVQLALDCHARAAYYDPNNYVLWQRVGHFRLKAGDRDGARQAFRHVKALRDWVHVPRIPEEE